jgi:hypothetical protein
MRQPWYKKNKHPFRPVSLVSRPLAKSYMESVCCVRPGYHAGEAALPEHAYGTPKSYHGNELCRWIFDVWMIW